MTLTGYPVEDLALRGVVRRGGRAALSGLGRRLAADGLGGLAVVVGYLDRSRDAAPRVGRPGRSPAERRRACCTAARSPSRYAKHHLPNYGVFDESRYFVPGDRLPVVRLHGVDVAIAICEDLWQDGGPVAAGRAAGAGLLVCINASPYEQGKDDDAAGARCPPGRARPAAPLAYVNMVGGQDELVFDGDSILVVAAGAAAGPRAAVRRGPAGRRPGPAARPRHGRPDRSTPATALR